MGGVKGLMALGCVRRGDKDSHRGEKVHHSKNKVDPISNSMDAKVHLVSFWILTEGISGG